MKKDFNNPNFTSVREFAILPNERVCFNSGQPRFVYFEENHQLPGSLHPGKADEHAPGKNGGSGSGERLNHPPSPVDPQL